MSNKNVVLNNLCAWDLYFNRANGLGSVKIPASAKGFAMLDFDEIKTQIQLGNKFFVGTDGMGDHARLEIVDAKIRAELFGLPDDAKNDPTLLNEESVKELLDIKSKSKFNDRLNQLVKTTAEKKMLVQMAFAAGAEEREAWKVDALRKMAEN